MSTGGHSIACCRSTEGVVRVLVERLVDQKKLVPAHRAMCRISVGPRFPPSLSPLPSMPTHLCIGLF